MKFAIQNLVIKNGGSDSIFCYLLLKFFIYSIALLVLNFGIHSTHIYQTLESISLISDFFVTALVLFVLFNKNGSRYRLTIFVYLLVTIGIFISPVGFDDLSYGLTLPLKIYNSKSLVVQSNYGVFTYFPSIDLARLSLLFSFGKYQSFILLRIESIAVFTASVLLFRNITLRSVKVKISEELVNLSALFCFSTLSAISIFTFAKPDSFIMLTLLAAVDLYLVRKYSYAILCSLVGALFKYTSIFSVFPIFVLSIIQGIRHRRFLSVSTFFVIPIILIDLFIWASYNYSSTGNPFYPYFGAIFPYSSDGIMNPNVYKEVIQFFLGQKDTSIATIQSSKYLQYVVTQLMFVFPVIFLSVFLLAFNKKLNVKRSFHLVCYSCMLSFIIFISILFSEFRYVYGLVALLTIPFFCQIIESFQNKLRSIKFIMVILILLQLSMCMYRSVKNSTYDINLAPYRINLSEIDVSVIKCANGYQPQFSSKTIATFDQGFFLWEKPYFFIHELNEFVGLMPTADSVRRAFDKYNVEYILLQASNDDYTYFNSLQMGSEHRAMPNRFMQILNDNYKFSRIYSHSCNGLYIYRIFPK